MFCSKCGSRNTDETRFCRGCGVELAGVPAALDQRAKESLELAAKAVELNSRGMLGSMLGLGFAIISAIVYSIPPQTGIFWLFPLAFSFFFFSTGVSRFVQARGLKALSKRDSVPTSSAAPAEVMKPLRSAYETDELGGLPASVTEHTTKHLDLAPGQKR